MKKGLKRFFLFGGGLFLLILIGVIIEWQYAVNRGKNKLNLVRAALDAAEPGWQLDELNGRRNANLPPDDRNVASIALKVNKDFPVEFNKWETSEASNWRGELKPNHLVDPKDLAELQKQFKPLIPLVAKLHEIRKFPTGGTKIIFPEPKVDDYLSDDTQKMREVASKLIWLALIATNDNDPATAIEACRTSAHLRHAIGDEPTLLSQLVRISLIAIAVKSTERTLGLTEPKAGLAELQADFEKALTEKYFLGGIEGERAMIDRLYENMASGKVLLTAGPGGASMLDSLYNNVVFSRQVRDNHTLILEMMTAMRDAAKKSGKERKAAIEAIPVPNVTTMSNMFAILMMPAVEKVVDAQTRSEVNLATIVVVLACERYRQANGKWPEKLSDIPKEILKEIPNDPYLGGPVKYKRTQTGIVVYATGKDEIDDGGVDLESTGKKSGSDIGIQLFDPAHRRLPPIPKPKDDAEGLPPIPEPDK